MNDPIYPVAAKVLQSLILFGDLSHSTEYSRQTLIKKTRQDLAFQIESGGTKLAKSTMERAMSRLATRGLLVMRPSKSALLPDCSPSSLLSMFTVRDTLDMTVGEQFNAKRNRTWNKARCDTLQQVMKFASFCYHLSGDAKDDTTKTESLLKRLEIVLTYADSIVQIAQQMEIARLIAAKLPKGEAELIQSKLVAPITGLPDELKKVAQCFGDLLAEEPSRQTFSESANVPTLRDVINDSIPGDFIESFFERIDFKGVASVKDLLRLDVKKRSRLLFQIRDAELHVDLAEDSGLNPVLPMMHMTHTLPDVRWTKFFLSRPTASFVDIMEQVLCEHKCILDSIDAVHSNSTPSDEQKRRVRLAIRNHMRMTLYRCCRVRDEFPDVSFRLEDVVIYPFVATEDDFAIFAPPKHDAISDHEKSRQHANKEGKEGARQKRASKK